MLKIQLKLFCLGAATAEKEDDEEAERTHKIHYIYQIVTIVQKKAKTLAKKNETKRGEGKVVEKKELQQSQRRLRRGQRCSSGHFKQQTT